MHFGDNPSIPIKGVGFHPHFDMALDIILQWWFEGQQQISDSNQLIIIDRDNKYHS